LNVGKPSILEFRDRINDTSIRRTPVSSLDVRKNRIIGDKFGNPDLHGTPDRVLYVLGAESMKKFAQAVGHQKYEPGTLGENVTLQAFDEHDISVGDIFRFGLGAKAVIAQATSPRIPCANVILATQNSGAWQHLRRNGRTGVYFRILKPGEIRPDSRVVRLKRAEVPLMISEVFERIARKKPLTKEQLERAIANGASPKEWLEGWKDYYEGFTWGYPQAVP
jgi:MOSC domain-containing protein YiiM